LRQPTLKIPDPSLHRFDKAAKCDRQTNGRLDDNENAHSITCCRALKCVEYCVRYSVLFKTLAIYRTRCYMRSIGSM